MQFDFIQNAKVGVVGSVDAKNHAIATIHVNDKYSHTFPANSRVSRHLESMSEKDLGERLNGGSFFFVGKDLIDFRDHAYNGFVHDAKSISSLVKTVGITPRKELSTRLHDNMVTSNWVLGSKWGDKQITVPNFNDGGEFKSELLFGWNPFVATVNSTFMIWRNICTNGMRGLTRFLNSRIPLVNRWEEHLDMAYMQIQNKVDGMVINRLSQMANERATVAELSTVADYAHKRIMSKNSAELPDGEIDRLRNLGNVANPVIHLSKVYRENVFTDTRLAAQMPGHLTTLDAYNIGTEIRSHTQEAEGSSTLAIDRFNNDLVFSRKDLTQHSAKYLAPRLSSFSDADTAFFGMVA